MQRFSTDAEADGRTKVGAVGAAGGNLGRRAPGKWVRGATRRLASCATPAVLHAPGAAVRAAVVPFAMVRRPSLSFGSLFFFPLHFSLPITDEHGKTGHPVHIPW